MGMYTELLFKAELKPDVPEDVVNTLLYMTGVSGQYATPDDHHPLFDAPRWQFVLRCSSAYFITGNTSMKFDTIGNRWVLVVSSSVKNYNGEIELFVDWVMPFVEDASPGGFLGYSMYEEAEVPSLIFHSSVDAGACARGGSL